MSRLGDIFNLVGGGTPTTSIEEYWGNGTPWISSADIDQSGRIVYRRRVTPSGVANSTTNVVPGGTVIVVTRVGLGKVAQLTEDTCFSQDIQALLARETAPAYNSRFLMYQLLFKMQTVKYSGRGTTISGITKKQLADVSLYFPPLPEQERIVARIEELFSQLDAGVETLKKTKAQLAVYRQAVLKEAFDSIEASFYHPLRAAILGSPQNGLYKPKSDYCDNGTPILRIDGFYDGFILSDYSFKRVSLSVEEIERYRLELGDLVVNRVNSMPYLGKCALVRSLIEPTVFESNMMRIKLDTDKVEGDWITYYLSSHGGRKELTKNAKQAVNQASINQTDVGNALVPIPSINEQKRLVTVIESRLSVCDSIEQTVDAALQQAEAMRQSILKDSFEGRL